VRISNKSNGLPGFLPCWRSRVYLRVLRSLCPILSAVLFLVLVFQLAPRTWFHTCDHIHHEIALEVEDQTVDECCSLCAIALPTLAETEPVRYPVAKSLPRPPFITAIDVPSGLRIDAVKGRGPPMVG